MNGLRLYINPSKEPAGDLEVFFSQRDDGPYYRWYYEEKLGRWRVARMRSDFSPKTLCMAPWKAVPAALQRSLGEHYQE